MSPSFGSAKSPPHSDLTVPLNDTPPTPEPPMAVGAPTPKALQSPLTARVRKNTAGSEDLGEKVSKMRIDMDDKNKRGRDVSRFNPEFRFNLEMAVRVAIGVIIASSIQTRESGYRDPDQKKQWYLFPEWYYLGGLSYCAVAVVFSAQKNVGATVREVCQAFYGVGIALVYNIILFAVLHIDMFDPSLPDPTKETPSGYVKITKTFSANQYFVNSHNTLVVFPWIMAFTIIILLAPIENNTKKFALGNNLYFSLTLINPNDPLKAGKLKATGDPYYSTKRILNNLELYFFVGFFGTLISFVIMFIPYPVFAIKRLRAETRKASEDILDMLNIIVDSYCFKNKNVEHMNFLRLKLRRKFDSALARHRRMNALIEDVWWEQLFGFHYLLKFNRSMIKNYVRLVGSLISDLRTLNAAMQLEKYEHLHFAYMKTLQREIYLIQLKSGDLLNDISREVHDCVHHIDLKSIAPLEAQMESTLQRYRSTQNRILRTQKVSLKDVEGNVPLNLFLFSLNSFCSTLINFQEQHNEKVYETSTRARAFVISSVKSFFATGRYNRLLFMGAFKASVAIFAGIFLAIYVYGFSHTTPAAVAYVMGNHIGGSFSVTVNRVGGVVAGSVVPSVFQFFTAQICSPEWVGVFLADLTLFVWVTISMYVRFNGGYGSYAGLVSAFIAVGVLLRQQKECGAAGSSSSLAVSSYSNMAQTSVGILLFIVVELALCPESASGLLRQNIQQTLKCLHKSFDILFGHHMSSTDEIDEATMEEVREILQVKVPALLAEQAKLLNEANAEPTLWKPEFSFQKYDAILDSCYRLLNNNNLLFKLVRWFNYRVKNKKVDLTNAVDIRNADDATNGGQYTHRQWEAAANKFQSSVGDTLATLDMLFGEGFVYADPEQTAIFMQMKEAFRLADKDCSGEIDAEEVAVMLEAIFAESGAVKESEIHDYVEQFMEIVDKDRSGKVSFEEFTDALDNGLKLEVEVYHQRKPKAPVLARQNTRLGGLSVISEENATDDRSSSNSASLQVITPRRMSAATPKTGKNAFTPKAGAIQRRTASTVSVGGGGLNSPMMRRQHDVLNVEDFSLADIADTMKSAYVQWLMENSRYEKVSMEELLLLNCLVSCAEGVARNLTSIEEIVVSH